MDKSPETIYSIERALDILILLSKEECEMGVVEISKMLGVYQSTVHRTMATLAKKSLSIKIRIPANMGLGSNSTQSEWWQDMPFPGSTWQSRI